MLLPCFLLSRTVQSPDTSGKAAWSLGFHLPNPRSVMALVPQSSPHLYHVAGL